MVAFKKYKNQPYITLNPEDVNNSELNDLIYSIKLRYGRMSNKMFDDLFNMLNSAFILLPPVDIGEDLFNLDNGDFYYLAFTDLDKYYDYFYDEDSIPVSFPFRVLIQGLTDDDEISFKGVKINPGYDDLIITPEMMGRALKQTKEKQLHKNTDLKKLRSKLNNDKKLSRFLSKSKKFDFEKFIKLTSKTYLFTYYVSVEDLKSRAKGGVIELKDEPGNIFIVDEFDRKCCMLFTSEKAMEPTLSFYKKRGRNIYSQITDLRSMAEYILKFNFDAIILNYANENILIPKEHVEASFRRIKKLNKNKKDYSNYVFMV